MKKYRNLVMMLVLIMGCIVTGRPVSAMEASYTVPVCKDITKLPGKSNTYNFEQEKDIVIPLVVKNKGIVYIGYQCVLNGADFTDCVDMHMYKDKECTIGVEDSVKGSGEDYTNCYEIEKVGTYYLKVKNDSLDGAMLTLSMSSVKAGDRTITSGESTAFCDSKYVYTKFKAKKNGYIEVAVTCFQNWDDVSIKLLNNKKKKVSEVESLNGEKIYYGVQKGKTYYIATKCNDLYSIKVKFTPVNGKTASTQKKAINMKKKKTYKGVVLANGKKSDVHYYKFVLKKGGKLRIKAGTKGYGNLRMEIYMYYNGDRYDMAGGVLFSHTDVFQDYPAGTYYIKIKKMNKYSNGYYSLKWY